MAFEWAAEDEVKQVLEVLREKDAEITWALFSYADANTIKLTNKGAGGLPEFRDLLQDDAINYVVLGQSVPDLDDPSYIPTKFIFINWVGTKCKPMEKAKSSQHRLPLYKFVQGFLQLSAELQVLEPAELSEFIILEKLRGSRAEKQEAGAGSESTPAPVQQPVETPSTTDTSNRSGGLLKTVATKNPTTFGPYTGNSDIKTEVKFEDENAANSTLQDVRSDDSPTKWVLFGHSPSGRDIIKIVGSGTGGLSEMLEHFTDDNILYGVLGQEVADEDGGSDYRTTKYIFLSWVGPSVKPMQKARSSQHRVALYKHSKNFLQLAAELQALSREEITEDLVKQKLCSTF